MALRGRGGILTRPLVDRARDDVLREYARAGIATDALAEVPVRLGWLGLDDAYGYFHPDGPGVIHLPRVTLARHREYLHRAPWTSVRDVLRHEYAHALAHLHPSCVSGRGFVQAFGAPIDHPGPAQPSQPLRLFQPLHLFQPGARWCPAHHVTPYATTSVAEDFAETVMVALRSDRPRRGSVLRRKLGYVAGLGRRQRVVTHGHSLG